MDIVWSTLKSSDGKRVLDQHGYVSVLLGPSYYKFKGARTLCGNSVAKSGVRIEHIVPEPLNEEKVCKTCLKIFKKNELLQKLHTS